MSVRNTVANVVEGVTPEVMSQGPPLPEYLHVKWPAKVRSKLLKFEAITDLDMKQGIIRRIRG